MTKESESTLSMEPPNLAVCPCHQVRASTLIHSVWLVRIDAHAPLISFSDIQRKDMQRATNGLNFCHISSQNWFRMRAQMATKSCTVWVSNFSYCREFLTLFPRSVKNITWQFITQTSRASRPMPLAISWSGTHLIQAYSEYLVVRTTKSC